MPLVPNVNSSPYPTIGGVMNLARVRVNDTLNDLSGDLLANDTPYAQPMLTAAWTWYKDRCTTAGVETLIKEVTLFNLPVQASQDPSNQAWITWEGCSDGVNQYEAPALPEDLIQPLSIWRRQAGSLGGFCLMRQAEDGLPRWFDCNVFDWRADGLYFYAPTNGQDFLIRYQAYWTDLDINFPDRQVPMARCEDCLAARIAFEFANARGAVQAPMLMEWAERAFQEGAAQRTSRRKQRQTIRRQPYGWRHASGFWPVYRNT